MSTQNPRLSIGMPAFNAAAYIEHALGSLMAQTFGDFEILVSDNVSTDATGEIVRRLATTDRRIRLVRLQTHVGANENYTFVAKAAQGEYFKWASSSDWCAPTFLEKCMSLLESDPHAVLAAPRTRLFEGDLANWRDYANDVAILDDSPAQRFIDLTTSMKLNNAMNGVVRTSALRRTRLIDRYDGADVVMMGHLAMLGKLLLVDEPLYYRRWESSTTTGLLDADSRRQRHYPTPSIHALFQHTKCNLGSLRAALSAEMPIRERGRVLKHVARRAYWDRSAITDDLRGAVKYLRTRRLD